MNNRLLRDEGRREFVRRALLLAGAVPALVAACDSCGGQTRRAAQARLVGGGCDGCEGIYEGMPQRLEWQTTIAGPSETGERMEMSGRVYRADGKTPAAEVILYVYHTDAAGYYSPAPGAAGLTRRHGHLRGWMRTGASGEYKFKTIRPAPYPSRDNPAHIHPIVKEPDKNEYYIDEYVFDDDPLLTPERRAKLENRGGSGVVRLTRAGGVWAGRRDITLGLNIPDYV
jgi:protocatechuate 3,4-dioxygenase beta subunit